MQSEAMQETVEDKEPEIVEEERKTEFTRPVILATVISSFGFVQYGYNFWVLHFPAMVLLNFYNATETKRSQFSLGENIIFFLLFVVMALYPLGGLVGSFVFAPLADVCGRKQTLIINCFFCMTCAILIGFSSMVEAYEYTLFSRFITGICSGICFNIVPVYLTEIAPKNKRGAIHVVASFFHILGILLGQIFTAPQLLGNEKGWPMLMSLAGFMALFQVLPLFYIPESPRYLLMQKGDEETARKVLQKLKGQDDVQEEMEDLELEDHAERAEKNMTVLRLLRFPVLRRRFVIVLFLMFAQQFAGSSAVYYYIDGIYLSTGLRNDKLQSLHIAAFTCLVLISFISFYLIDSVGRRILLLTGFGICSICCAILPVTIHFQKTHFWLSYINTMLIIIFLLGHFLGPASIPQLLVSELFLQSSRCSAFAVSGATFWLCKVIATLTLGGIEAALKAYTFLLYMPIGIATFFYIYTFVPETKKKTFREIRKVLATQATKKIVVT